MWKEEVGKAKEEERKEREEEEQMWKKEQEEQEKRRWKENERSRKEEEKQRKEREEEERLRLLPRIGRFEERFGKLRDIVKDPPKMNKDESEKYEWVVFETETTRRQQLG